MNLKRHIGNYFRSLAVKFTGNASTNRDQQFDDTFDELISLERELAQAQQSILEFVERNRDILNSLPESPSIAPRSIISHDPIDGNRWIQPIPTTETNGGFDALIRNLRRARGKKGTDYASSHSQTNPPSPAWQPVSVKIRLDAWQGLEAEVGIN